MKRNSIVASVVAAFAATAASAGTIVVPTPDPVIVVAATADPIWDGFYAGGFLGWDTGEEHTIPAPPPPVAFDGLTYGGFVGYNFVMDSGLMVGGELAASRVNREFATPATNHATIFDAKLRVGFAADRALVFASGGYSMSVYDGGGFEGQGWNLGAGVDYLVTDSLFVGAEYVYRDITDSLGTPAIWEDKSHTFQVRAGFKF